MQSMAPVLTTGQDKLSEEIKATFRQLFNFKEGLSSSARKRFHVRVHKSLPFGSTIILDQSTKEGRVQIETKPYKSEIAKSFGLEVMPKGEHDFYTALVEGYTQLLDDGDDLDQSLS